MVIPAMPAAGRWSRSRWRFTAAVLLQIILLYHPSSAQNRNDEYCSMYGICAKRSDGKVLNCVNTTSAVKPDSLFSSRIQSLCPTISGNVCCTVDQFKTLHDQVQQAVPFLVGCPACLRNFLNLFCEMSCSPHQGQFINVTSAVKVNNTVVVGAIDFFVTSEFGTQLYDSCKDVQFGSLNSRVMDFIGAGAHNYQEWFAFLGRKADLNAPGSTFPMTFRTDFSNAAGAIPLNVTTYSCGDPSLGCSCGDCPSSPVCTESSAPPSTAGSSCSIKLGSLKVRCLDFTLSVIYLVFLGAFLLWSLLYRRQMMRHFSPGKKESKSFSVQQEEQSDQPMQSSGGVQFSRQSGYGSFVQNHMANFFRWHGTVVARHPLRVLFLSLIVPVLLSIGLIRFKVETRPAKLWVGPGSQAAMEKEYFDTNLAPFYRIEQLILSTPVANNGRAPSILNDDSMKLLFQIQQKVDALRVNYSGSQVSLTDICLNPLGTNCATESILQYYQMDPSKYDNLDHAMYCFEHYSSDETCLSAFTSPVDPSTVLGGFSGNNFSEASVFVITYPVNNQAEVTGEENAKAIAWERAFTKLVKEEIVPMVQAKNLKIAYSSESSIQDELSRESTADVITILISYIVMFAYISFTLGDSPSSISSLFVSSKALLGLSGVILVIISVLGSMGFFSAIGIKSTLIIMEVIPFLVLAVGVDNMCIIVHAVKRQPAGLPLEARISDALVEVGPSITLASLSEVVAFAVSAISPMPATRVFSLFAALAILLDFFLQVTAFVALVVFDFLRAEDGRIDCIPCVKIRSAEQTDSSGKHDRHLLARYMKEIHTPTILYWPVRILVILLFVGFTFASIALCSRIQPGLEQQIVLPRDSYLQDYFDDLVYLRVGAPVYFVVKDFNYSSGSDQTNKICSINQCNPNSLLNEIARAALSPETSYIARPAASWLDDFLVWVSPNAFGCCRKFVNGSYCPPDDQPPCCQNAAGSSLCSATGACDDCTTCFLQSNLTNGRPSTAQFQEKLPWFLDALPSTDCAKGGKGAYTSSLNLTGFQDGIVRASSFRTYHTALAKQSDYINSYKAAREFSAKMSKSLQLEIFPYSVFYMFFEQYLNIWQTAALNIGVALGAVLVVFLIVTGSFWASVIILTVLAMIVVDMMGVMAILGIQLNALSVVNLVMSIGIAVEFCVHIMHGFMTSSGDKRARVEHSLSTMGASVFSGITLTKLVGVIVLRFAKSEVFVVYYFSMYLSLVLIGFLHGLVFLPVVLSFCGPPPMNHKNPSAPQDRSASNSVSN